MRTATVARVNLTAGTVSVESSSDFYDWLGGRGFGVRTLQREVSAGDDPFSPGNKLIFATGCFNGTSLPGSTRIELVTRNALNGGISYSSAGGTFATALRSAGFDALIVEGSARKPCYIYLEDDTVEIRDAQDLWGMTTWDTEEAIRERLGIPDLSVACIGPAGERQARIACIIIDKAHALGWGGSGGIMGSKNLKAIVARKGSRPSVMARPDRFEEVANHYRWVLLSGSAAATLKAGGTHGMSGAGGWNGKVPVAVRNLQDEYWDPERLALINERAFKKYEVGRTGCPECPIRCQHLYSMERDGEVLSGEGMHANSVRGLGTNWEVDDPFAIFKAHVLCNRLGLDVDGVSSSVAWAVECFEKGKLGPSDTGGLELRWGNHKDIAQLIEDIGYRRGFGDLLAEGVWRASRATGRGTGEFAMTVKRVGINEQSLRSHKAWALGIAVSTRGGGHLGGSPQIERRGTARENAEWLFGNSELPDPGSYEGKGRVVAWYETYKAIVDSLGICYFCAGWYELALAHLGFFVDLFNSVTGASVTAEEMWKTGRRIVNVEKAFNAVAAGFTRDDDKLPARMAEIPVSDGTYKGARLDPDKFDAMVTEYYAAHGWDPLTGLQRAGTLLDLGLRDLVEYLGDKVIS